MSWKARRGVRPRVWARGVRTVGLFSGWLEGALVNPVVRDGGDGVVRILMGEGVTREV